MENEYEKFMEGFMDKKYVSVTAEYKRTIKKTVKKNIQAKEDVIFKAILESVLKKSDLEGDKFFFEGEKISTKNNKAFIYKFVENKTFAYIYKSNKSQDYFVMTFEIEATSRNYSVVEFTYETKIQHTVTGFNGKLGNMKFSRQARAAGNATLEKLKLKVCGPDSKKTNKKK